MGLWRFAADDTLGRSGIAWTSLTSAPIASTAVGAGANNRPYRLGRRTAFVRAQPAPDVGLASLASTPLRRHVGPEAHIYPKRPDHYSVGSHFGSASVRWETGRSSTRSARSPSARGRQVSRGAHLCAGTHDLARYDRPLVKPPIVIGDDAWIAADVFVGPGVTVGPGSGGSARAVVMKDVRPDG